MRDMPAAPERVTQQRVDQVVGLYVANSKLPESELSRQFNSGEWSVGEASPDFPDIMLASVSKVAYGYIYAQLLAQMPDVKSVTIDADIITSLLERDPDKFWQEPIYQPLRNKVQHMFTAAGPGADLRAGFTAQEIHDSLQNSTLEIPISELFYLAITISSNSATRLIRKLIGEKLGPDVELTRVKELIPGFSPLVSSEHLHHWLELRPNIGKLDEFAKLLHKLATDWVAGNLDEYQKILVQSMRNNPVDHKFCFTHSAKGKELIAQGYSVLEKTGYYPCVFWIEDLAKAGYPPHMVMCNAVSVISPQKEVSTFCQFISHEVKMPWKQTEIEDIRLPAEFGEEYGTYSGQVKAQVALNFRLNQSQVQALQ